ncbi:hypothetical protein H5T57_00215 [Candidatus Bipolaricaulota bacterium]|nr:hypothetical protein [Candidatus Bipolaricaulota bacterium]
MSKWWVAVAVTVGAVLALGADVVIYEFTPEMIAAAWQPYLDPESGEFLGAGTVSLIDGKAVVGVTFGEPWGGGVISPWLLLDVSKNPVIILLNVQPKEKWTLKAHLRGLKPDVFTPVEAWGTYLIGDNNLSGDVEINLAEGIKEFAPVGVIRALPNTPIIAIRLWFWGVGGPVSVDGIRIVYRTE